MFHSIVYFLSLFGTNVLQFHFLIFCFLFSFYVSSGHNWLSWYPFRPPIFFFHFVSLVVFAKTTNLYKNKRIHLFGSQCLTLNWFAINEIEFSSGKMKVLVSSLLLLLCSTVSDFVLTVLFFVVDFPEFRYLIYFFSFLISNE